MNPERPAAAAHNAQQPSPARSLPPAKPKEAGEEPPPLGQPEESDGELGARIATMIRARLVSTLLDMGMAVALVRMLPKTEFAVLGVAFVTYELAKQLAVGGFADSLLIFIPTASKGTRRALAMRTAQLLLGTGAIAALVTLGMAASADYWLSQWQAADRAMLKDVLYLFALVCVCEFPTLPMTQLLLALNRQTAAGRWEIFTSAATLTALLGPLLLGGSVVDAAFATACWAAFRVVVSLFLAHWVLPPTTESLPKGSLREQLHFALPLGVHTLVSRVNKHADKLIVTLLMPSAALAEYGAACNELPFVNLFPFVMGSVLASRYALAFNAGTPETALRLWKASLRKATLTSVPIGILCIVFAPELITLAFGLNYENAVTPFRILSGTILIRIAQYGSVLQAARDSRSILKFSLIAASTNIVLGLALTPFIGLAGTAAATLIASLVGLVFYCRRIATHLHTPWQQVLPFKRWAGVLATSLAAAAFVKGVLFLWQPQALPVKIAVIVPLFGLSNFLLLRVCGLWTRGDARAARLLLKF